MSSVSQHPFRTQNPSGASLTALFVARRIISPTVATFALSRLGFSSVGGIGAGTMGVLVLLFHAGVVDAAPEAVSRAPKHL